MAHHSRIDERAAPGSSEIRSAVKRHPRMKPIESLDPYVVGVGIAPQRLPMLGPRVQVAGQDNDYRLHDLDATPSAPRRGSRMGARPPQFRLNGSSASNYLALPA